jgi:serine/threonine protein kinase
MDSYVNSVLELFNFVDDENEGFKIIMSSYTDENNTGVKANASAVRVDINQLYKFKDVLGSGTYSVVRLAIDRKTNEEVAIKVITKSQLSGDDTVSLNVFSHCISYIARSVDHVDSSSASKRGKH